MIRPVKAGVVNIDRYKRQACRLKNPGTSTRHSRIYMSCLFLNIGWVGLGEISGKNCCPYGVGARGWTKDLCECQQGHS